MRARSCRVEKKLVGSRHSQSVVRLEGEAGLLFDPYDLVGDGSVVAYQRGGWSKASVVACSCARPPTACWDPDIVAFSIARYVRGCTLQRRTALKLLEPGVAFRSITRSTTRTSIVNLRGAVSNIFLRHFSCPFPKRANTQRAERRDLHRQVN